MPRSTPQSRSKKSQSPGCHVALLRGINVGGKNKLPMADLVALMAKLGCADCRHYIQSGNVVFCAQPDALAELPQRVAQAIAKRFKLTVPVILRSAAELQTTLVSNPYLNAGADPATLYVGFLADRPEAARVAALDPNRSPGDEFAVVGRDIYMRLGNGAADTKLTTAYFDAKLGTTSTFRNWRTVHKLAELASD